MEPAPHRHPERRQRLVQLAGLTEMHRKEVQPLGIAEAARPQLARGVPRLGATAPSPLR